MPESPLVTNRQGSDSTAIRLVPAERTMTYRFLNSTPADFVTVTNEVVLPDGYVVTSIDDSDPPSNESSTTPEAPQ